MIAGGLVGALVMRRRWPALAGLIAAAATATLARRRLPAAFGDAHVPPGPATGQRTFDEPLHAR